MITSKTNKPMHAKKNRQKYFTAFVIVEVFFFILFSNILIFY
jgi:hypothetical protein